MARLSDLVVTTSRALRFDERSVNLCARYLREAGLIAQKGRGPSAANMAPRDATNLLLGIMASDTIKDAAVCVKLAREAIYMGGEVNFGGEVVDELPPYSFLKDDDYIVPLGKALDRLFDELVRYGTPSTDDALPLTGFSFLVRRPGLYAEMTLYDDNTYFTARYRREHPRLESLRGAERLEEMRKVDLEEQWSMETLTRINLEPVWIIANVLRGYEAKPGDNLLQLHEDQE